MITESIAIAKREDPKRQSNSYAQACWRLAWSMERQRMRQLRADFPAHRLVNLTDPMRAMLYRAWEVWGARQWGGDETRAIGQRLACRAPASTFWRERQRRYPLRAVAGWLP